LPGRAAMAIAAFAVAYYALAVFGVGLPLQARFPLFVWPADGLALGALLVAPRALWIPFAGIAFAASLATGMQAGMGVEASTATALVNALEPAVIAIVLLRLSERRTDIASLQGLTAFLVNLVPLSAVVSLGDAAV